MDLRALLQDIRRLQDLMRLAAWWGHEAAWEKVPDSGTGVRVVGRYGEFPWLGLSAPDPERAGRTLARRWASRGRLAGVLALGQDGRRLAIAIALDGIPAVSLDLAAPDPVALGCVRRLAGTGERALAYAARAAEALAGEAVGRRFYREFRSALERMAEGLPGPARAEDRRAYALLQLTRVLFLYFVQAKGWLAGRDRFLADSVDACLSRGRRLHRDLLRPLFFGTLNRPAAERGRVASTFGAIPFLNGGLFEPHPIERRLSCDVANPIWRDAFDGLFERFHFTVAEGTGDGRIAPDMLGRVFEGVMAPDARRASGTYYTPAVLVHQLLDAAFAGHLAHHLRCGESEAERRLAERDVDAIALLERACILDPAVGSGAFLLGALEKLGGTSSARRRAVLNRNLFGVDRNGAAVRLTELRLWLAVIAEDTADRPELVQPLPNLDCLIRQGDSLFEPVGSGLRLRSVEPELAAALSQARRQVVTATGKDKRAQIRRLEELEVRATSSMLATAEADLHESIEDLLRDARGADLFGRRKGLEREARLSIARLRREMHAIRPARRIVAREREVPWFHYQCHFADVFARGGFDIVVGNPPWLRAEQVPAELRRRLSGRYRWWRTSGRGYANRPDLAVAFLERALELAVPGGHVAFLVPAKLANAGYAAAARHGLAANCTLLRVADLTGRPEAAFDATVYPLAIVLRKSPPQSDHRVRMRLDGAPGSWVKQARLTGGAPWVLTREPLSATLAMLAEAHPRLGTMVGCHLGLKTGANRIFLNPPADIEPELRRPALRGRDVGPFRAISRAELLYTHAAGGTVRASLPPRATRYLRAHSAALRARADYDGGPLWTLFRAGHATARHRVVWPDLARQLAAAALTAPEDEALVPLNSCYVAALGNASQADGLASWLNSTWMRAVARARAVPAASGFARFTAGTVGELPLPPVALTDQRLASLAVEARRGEPVQRELDDLVARHLELKSSARSALLAVVGGGSAHRR
jgi:Eco57I restriction-modification methylase